MRAVSEIEARPTIVYCTVCLAGPRRCICPYFHKIRLLTLPFEPKLDHNRPNPFTNG